MKTGTFIISATLTVISRQISATEYSVNIHHIDRTGKLRQFTFAGDQASLTAQLKPFNIMQYLTSISITSDDASKLITIEQVPSGHFVLCSFREELKHDATLTHDGNYYRFRGMIDTGDYDSTADYIEERYPWALMAFYEGFGAQFELKAAA